MPASEHAEYPAWRKASRNAQSGQETKSSAARRGRKGIPIDINDTASSILSPLLYRLPSISGIPTLKGFLPSSASARHNIFPSSTSSQDSIDSKAIWQKADLGDGRGKRHLLLITSATHALRIFAFTSNIIPDDPHVKETWAAPEEIFSLAKVVIEKGERGYMRVISARLLKARDEPAVVVITSTAASNAGEGKMKVAIISLRKGLTLRSRELDMGRDAIVLASARALVVGVASSNPVIHILHPDTLEPLHQPITNLPVHPRSGLPTFDLSHRLLALAISEPPRHPGSSGLGSILTQHNSAYTSRPATSPGLVSTSQGDILTSAMDIGGGVARGVWAGLKLSARAANAARVGRLARSAPAEATLGMEEEEEVISDDSEVMEDDCGVVGQNSRSREAGIWIKVIDLFPRKSASRSSVESASGLKGTTGSQEELEFHTETVAHFRLPAPRPAYTAVERGISAPHTSSITHLTFSPSGMHLFAADSDGRSFRILELHPVGMGRITAQGEVKGEVWDLYELRRGNTAGTVGTAEWSDDGRWIGVSTGKGTIHVFPLNASGGSPTAASHVSTRIVNPTQLHPLSSIVHPTARLRPRHRLVNDNGRTSAMSEMLCTFAFTDLRGHPVDKSVVCQDINIFRPTTGEMEVNRLTLQRSPPARLVPGLTNEMHRRGSGLTEMMRTKAGLAMDQSDLAVEHSLRAGWALPLDIGDADLVIGPGKTRRPVSTLIQSSLARAEIQTHVINPRILPSSIYLSRQVDFYAARPIDEYAPLSILDLDARTHRLTFRPEVEVRSTSPEAKSFDEPLLTALHSIIESPSHPEIPGLPNGYPHKPRWRSSIPIRQVASGLGEGVGRVRMEYARAQHSRLKRRLSEAGANSLSFEEDAVFATLSIEDEESNTNSSPSSGILPESTDAGSQGVQEEEEWGEGWEEEYRKAVEDDGGPEELVLGLMDEEEEERRKWESKGNVRQYTKYDKGR